ncbi:hypothetical protein HPO96_28460 [Kribbella sandramycini]|uniref:GNAT superfamily N-acetyltransferase n=1 Tax=Kribbella sandramycini TaxID=60450 RepID=A0A7Y4L685_9ACTN|nr:GNAT family N-acetyltransferase [Kribbella sandramycini]MBB6571538.1 GNAT superfamily N-acetyltransferase [Kribbella sandramycini]NOL44187.1 hypothetical protein [Kribbella sandramycini]
MRERVLKAAAEWVFVPPDAEDIVTAEYRLILYPDRASVQWSRAERPFAELLAEVRERSTAYDKLRWWVDARTAPSDTAEALLRNGFRQIEELEILACDVTDVEALAERLEVPSDVQVRAAADLETIQRAAAVDTEIFGWSGPTQRALELEFAAVTRGERSSPRFVAEIDGELVASSGYTLMGDIVGLWGAGVLEKARGRGVYRALIAARCRAARADGAELALVTARTTTSAPTLRRAGFAVHGTKRCYELWNTPDAR